MDYCGLKQLLIKLCVVIIALIALFTVKNFYLIYIKKDNNSTAGGSVPTTGSNVKQ